MDALRTPVVAPNLAHETNKLLTQMLFATKAATAASLTSGIIAASGRAWSVEEALELQRTVSYALHPQPGYGHYNEWFKNKNEELSKLRA